MDQVLKPSVNRTKSSHHFSTLRQPKAAGFKLLILALVWALLPITSAASPRRKTPIHRDVVAQDSAPEPSAAPWIPNQHLGYITSADTDRQIAVLYLDTTQHPLNTRLIARDFELNPTAILEVTPIQRGRAVGLTIIQGSPLVGHEVILPGSAYRESFGDLLQPSATIP